MPSSPELELRVAEPSDAAAMLDVIHAAFGARRPVHPPAAALSDTVADVEEALGSGHGVCACLDGRLAGCLLLAVAGDVATLRRVSVLPEFRGSGVARALVEGAVSLAVDLGCTHAELMARREFPELVEWWGSDGFRVDREVPGGLMLRRRLPVIIDVPTAQAMQDLGRTLGTMLKAGDVVIATGDLGAGKTTLTQGIAAGLGVSGQVTSPTFVISRVHPNGAGPALVHVDAYRMADAAELNDIDLEATLASSVTVVEWGRDRAEWLSDQRLEVRIDRSEGDDTRTVYLDGLGQRWDGALEPFREMAWH